MSLNEIVKTMQDAVNRQTDQAKPGGYDTTATVRRIEGDTAFVHIPGGVDETPVKLTINAKAGDNVQVRVSGGNAFLVGNGSSPPTDDARANQAYTVATVAEGAAENALANAARAAEAADSAQASATRAEGAANDAVIAAGDAQTAAGNAQTAADTALVNLATTEDVVGVLNWITAHGTMTTQSGGVFVPGQVYFVLDDATPGDYHVGNHYYSVVPEPKAADIDSYYVLTVDESVQNYVATHIVVDSEGLWIIPDAGGNKVLIATGNGSTYTTAGTYIVGAGNVVLASFTASGAVIGQTGETRSEIDYHSMKLIDKEGDPYLHISDIRETSGYITITDEWLGHGTRYDLSNIANSTTYEITVDGSAPQDVILEKTTEFFRFNDGYNQNHTVRAVYQTADQSAKGYTLGIRDTGNIGGMSFVSGSDNVAEGMYSSATGYSTQALGKYSHSEGYETKTDYQGYGAHAEGYQTYVKHEGCHAEGRETRSNGSYSHAEGYKTLADMPYCHSEGDQSMAMATGSHAEGYYTYANGNYSHTQNYRTTASSDYQTVLGKYNVADSLDTYAVIVGNGTGEGASRSNALTVAWTGDVVAEGDITDGSSNVLSNKQDKLTASDLTKPSVTKTSGNSTCTVRDYAGYGKVRMLTLSFKTTAAVSAGSNVFVGTLTTTSAQPIIATSGAGYIGSSAVIATIGSTGTITVRNIGAQIANAQEPYVYFTYIVS